MQSFQIGKNEAGQRLDKFLHKYLPNAGNGFLYKMIRKKNITLNGKKAEGSEFLKEGDNVSFFFSEETFFKFSGISPSTEFSSCKDLKEDTAIEEYASAYKKFQDIQIIYEDAHVLLLNKPAGILTQKAQKDSLSANEWLISYLLHTGQITLQELHTFRPSVCNRLDRNTSGLVLCGKSFAGSQSLSCLIRERSVKKLYRTFVKGQMNETKHITGYLAKDEQKNKVSVSLAKAREDMAPIETVFEPIKALSDMTYLEVELITGKTHQIRAHLAAIGHPILGDYKYGDKKWNDRYQQNYGIRSQVLHAYRMEFPELEGVLEPLSGKKFKAPLPEIFTTCLHEQRR